MPRRPNTDLARELRHEQTPPEGILWSRLRSRRLNGIKFRRQHTIGPYIVDFCCVEATLVVEIDGNIHKHPETASRDQRRDEFLASHGYAVLRIPASEVRIQLAEVLRRIDRVVTRRVGK